jgi:hypothetical protein
MIVAIPLALAGAVYATSSTPPVAIFYEQHLWPSCFFIYLISTFIRVHLDRIDNIYI